MKRDEFLKSMGLGIALVCTGSCLSGCGSKENDPKPNGGGNGGGTTGNKVSIDLATQLTGVGSSLASGGVLFIRLSAGNNVSSFVATQAACPHQGGALNWITATNLIQCSLHASQYNSSGSVVTPPNDGGTTAALKVYALSLTGTTLTATIS